MELTCHGPSGLVLRCWAVCCGASSLKIARVRLRPKAALNLLAVPPACCCWSFPPSCCGHRFSDLPGRREACVPPPVAADQSLPQTVRYTRRPGVTPTSETRFPTFLVDRALRAPTEANYHVSDALSNFVWIVRYARRPAVIPTSETRFPAFSRSCVTGADRV